MDYMWAQSHCSVNGVLHVQGMLKINQKKHMNTTHSVRSMDI